MGSSRHDFRVRAEALSGIERGERLRDRAMEGNPVHHRVAVFVGRVRPEVLEQVVGVLEASPIPGGAVKEPARLHLDMGAEAGLMALVRKDREIRGTLFQKPGENLPKGAFPIMELEGQMRSFMELKLA